MKALRTPFFIAVLLAISSCISYASVDMYLKIEPIGGGRVHIIHLQCTGKTCTERTATVNGLQAGRYAFTLCDGSGNALQLQKHGCLSTCSITLKVSGTTAGEKEQSSAKNTRFSVPITFTREIHNGGMFTASGDITTSGTITISIIWNPGTDRVHQGHWESPLSMK